MTYKIVWADDPPADWHITGPTASRGAPTAGAWAKPYATKEAATTSAKRIAVRTGRTVQVVWHNEAGVPKVYMDPIAPPAGSKK